MKGVKENNNNNSLLTWIVMTGNGWFLLYSLWGHKVGLFKCELFWGGASKASKVYKVSKVSKVSNRVSLFIYWECRGEGSKRKEDGSRYRLINLLAHICDVLETCMYVAK